MTSDRAPRSKFASVLRTVLYALAVAFLIGWLIGTWLRHELEKPTRYLGANASVQTPLV